MGPWRLVGPLRRGAACATLLACTLLAGCEGEAGPQGIAGPQGAQGPAGPQGAPGTAATTGPVGFDLRGTWERIDSLSLSYLDVFPGEPGEALLTQVTVRRARWTVTWLQEQVYAVAGIDSTRTVVERLGARLTTISSAPQGFVVIMQRDTMYNYSGEPFAQPVFPGLSGRPTVLLWRSSETPRCQFAISRGGTCVESIRITRVGS